MPDKPLIHLAPYLQEGRLEAGCDEAGRGCLAGPVFAAAVILPPDFYHPLLNDSKQMTEAHRRQLRPIIEAQALAWAVATTSAQEIDEINILRASIKAMHRALDRLVLRPSFILVDGNKFLPYRAILHQCFVKGDGRFASIAAASVLAKTHRDAYMEALDSQFPGYHWAQNKGYPTQEHRQALQDLGPTPHHRLTFCGCKEYIV